VALENIRLLNAQTVAKNQTKYGHLAFVLQKSMGYYGHYNRQELTEGRR